MLSRVRLSLIIGLLTVAAASAVASAGLVFRAIGPAPVSSIVEILLAGSVVCLALAVALIATSESSDLSLPSDEPRLVGWTVAGVGLAIVVVAAGSATVGGTAPGFVESAAIAGGTFLTLCGYPAYRLARTGTLDRWVEPNGAIVLSPGQGGLWTEPATTPWYRATPVEIAVTAAIVTILAVTYLMVLSDGPLGHDEAVYAVKARSWLEGTPATGFGLHRPVGMPAIGWVVLHVSDSEVAFRLMGVAAAAATLCGVWGVGRRLFSPAAGLLAVAVLGSASSWLRRVPEFLNDIITSGLLLWIMYVIWRHFEDPEVPRWRIVMAAPLAAATFYLRYGIVSALLVVALVAGILWRRKLVASWRYLASTAVVLFVLVLPHISYSIARTGSPLGILSRASDAAGREYLGEGLVDYLRWFRSDLAGPFAGVLMIAACVAVGVIIVRAVIGSPLARTDRAVVYLGASGMLMMVVTGLVVHAEHRYVFSTVMLLLLVGGNLAVGVLRHVALRIRPVLVAVAAIAFAMVLVPNASMTDDRHDRLAESGEVLVGASASIDPGPSGECVAVSTYVPHITWYAECTTIGFDIDPAALGSTDIPAYIVVFANGKRQPSMEALMAYIPDDAVVHARIVSANDVIGDAVIYRLAEGS